MKPETLQKKSPPEKTSFWCFSGPACLFDSFLRGFFANCTMVKGKILELFASIEQMFLR